MKKCTELTSFLRMGRSKVHPVAASSFHSTSLGLDVKLDQKKLTYSQLPKLTLPPLQETLAKFINFSKPIQNPAEFNATCVAVDNFLKSGEADRLNKILEDRVKNLKNWLTPWWLDIAYLEARTPLPIVTSPGVAFEYFEFLGQEGQIECAARMIQAALMFHHKIIDDQLPEDKAGNTPFDMTQYKYLYGTTRVPKLNKDEIRYGSSQPKWAQHVIVTRNGHSFHVPVYGKNGEVLSLDELKAQIRQVLPDSEKPNEGPINVVSSGGRDEWARVYERLKKSNPSSILSYENALFVVCLDNPAAPRPNTTALDEQMQQALHGGGTHQNTVNRWFDKTIQFIVSQNGYNGLCYEHTPAEGPPIANLMDFITDKFEKDQFINDKSGAPTEKPHKLTFSLTSEDHEALKIAAKRINDAAADLEAKFYLFKHFGKSIPKLAKVSPDSFVQVAFQLAYYRLHGKPAPTYETATLRKFDEGRTDTIRSPTSDSKAFVEAMEGGRPAEEVARLFRAATESHKNYAVSCMNGRGMDRHLLGLRLAARENNIPIPDVFKSDAYKKLNHFLISTSQVPTRHLIPMAFGPSESDCYGVCYNPQEHQISFSITTYNHCAETSAKTFAQTLEKTLLDIRDMLDRAGQLKAKAKI